MRPSLRQTEKQREIKTECTHTHSLFFITNKPYSLFQRFKILYGIGGLNYGMGKRHQIVRTSKRASGREARDFEKTKD